MPIYQVLSDSQERADFPVGPSNLRPRQEPGAIFGVDIGPLIEAELDRRHPERATLRPGDADGQARAARAPGW